MGQFGSRSRSATLSDVSDDHKEDKLDFPKTHIKFPDLYEELSEDDLKEKRMDKNNVLKQKYMILGGNPLDMELTSIDWERKFTQEWFPRAQAPSFKPKLMQSKGNFNADETYRKPPRDTSMYGVLTAMPPKPITDDCYGVVDDSPAPPPANNDCYGVADGGQDDVYGVEVSPAPASAYPANAPTNTDANTTALTTGGAPKQTEPAGEDYGVYGVE